MRRTFCAAAAGLVLAVGGAVVSPAPEAATAAVPAAPKPKPRPSTPTLPVPRPTVDPKLSIGGERLASMGVVVDLPAGVPAPPRLKDVSWVLADMDSGEVVAAKAAHARLLPASTLKTLTALTLIPKVDANRPFRATAEDANADGTRVGLLPGQTYTGRQLFSALLMSSGNDAAYALARAGGGRQATLAAMNQEARQLGAHDTVAKDPSGLDAPGQTSSAYDLALIGRAAMQLPDFRTYVTTKQLKFPGAKGRNGKRASFVISNHNRLLYNYDGTIGIKNGYTNAAKRTFISAVTRGGKTYILTEMYGLDNSWRPQAAMYDWAFRWGGKARPVGRLVHPGEVTEPPTPAPAATDAPGAPAADAAKGDGRADGAAAAIPSALGSQRVPPWVGVASLAAAVLLVALFAVRGITGGGAGRRPSRHRAR
ncbi:D-alanyl-D-alanine carboxypeptidase [Phycicoccus sp. SLBN-51]|uniref:D-alanyl-D-alanine carboxypeptidase family protein n=1 Tax=Phycicoccus sp. SLBN-51 TaxID=2768447 RepID=UPI001150CF65|nr:D-alanyl-D-alanine carboxypeptidase [Phycicoccus sp. SLBN-51]TQJ51886.1 D-alanyl-D-alanine carboxypeptidase (penicillin-binding protein 5/6) [Phycicoccus sp. SLBN-51]